MRAVIGTYSCNGETDFSSKSGQMGAGGVQNLGKNWRRYIWTTPLSFESFSLLRYQLMRIFSVGRILNNPTTAL